MKLKKKIINQKLLKLYLLKLRTYEQYHDKLKTIITRNVNQTLIDFKKALRILFKFHTKNKKILFLGLNGLILKKINKETIHTAIPSNIKLQNITSNKTKLNNNFKYSLLKLKKKPKLIVILDRIDFYSSFIYESYMSKIPIVTLSKSSTVRKNALLYNLEVTPEFLLQNKNLFYNCLKFLFKKPKIRLNKFKILKKYTKYEKKKI